MQPTRCGGRLPCTFHRGGHLEEHLVWQTGRAGGHRAGARHRPGHDRSRGARPAALPPPDRAERGRQPGGRADADRPGDPQRLRGELGRGNRQGRRAAHGGAAPRVPAHGHARDAAPEHRRRHAGARPGRAQGQRLQPADAHPGAVGAADGTAAAVQHPGLAHAVRRAHSDAGRGRCARHSYRAVGGQCPGVGAQTRHLPSHLCTRAARQSARIGTRRGRRPAGHAEPGTGGHAAGLHRAAGRAHRGTDAKPLATPLVLGALSAHRAHGARRRF